MSDPTDPVDRTDRTDPVEPVVRDLLAERYARSPWWHRTPVGEADSVEACGRRRAALVEEDLNHKTHTEMRKRNSDGT